MDARLASLLASLDPPLRALVDRALETAKADRVLDAPRLDIDAAGAVLSAVGIAPNDKRRVPLPSDLSDVQRCVFEIVALAGLPAYSHVFGGNGQAILRWLGLTPPSPLEETVEYDGRTVPLWWALVDIDQKLEAQGRSPDRRAHYRASMCAKVALLDAMPFERAIRTIDCLLSFARIAYGFPPLHFFWGGEHGPAAAAIASLRDEGAAWGRAQLDAWTARSAADPKAILETERALVWLFAVVRGGQPIEPRWDGVYVYAVPRTAPASMFVECALALPEARRAPAIVAAMEERAKGLGSDKLRAVLALLEVHDSSVITAALIEAVKDGVKQSALEAKLGELAGTRLGVRSALTAWQATLAKPRALKAKARVHPVDESLLLASHAAQLAALRKSDPDDFDDPEMVGDLELRTIVDSKGKHVLDLWLFASDSGAVFAAGATREIAHLVQGSVELAQSEHPDASLLAGLRAVLEVKPPPATTSVNPTRAARPKSKPKSKPKPKR